MRVGRLMTGKRSALPFERIRGELVGDVRIYCSVTASYSFLFDILSRFRENHPRVEIRLHTGDPEEAIPRVLSGTEDIAIGARPDRLACRHWLSG